nr:hypothetical protein [Aeromicrobium sp.]
MRTDLPVYLRLATPRVALDSPGMRFGALALAALELAGARAQVSAESGVPSKSRDDALSWTRQHDRLLRDLVAAATPADEVHGPGVVLSNDSSTVARRPLDDPAGSVPALWAAPASALVDLPPVPPAALTLTEADAAVLSGLGVRAIPLLAWPRPVELGSAPRRVLIAAAADADPDLLLDVIDAVASVLPGRPVIDVVPDVRVVVDGVPRAPLHPWRRSHVARSSDLVLVVGRSASTDLLAAEASQVGAARWRVAVPCAPVSPGPHLAALAAALPGALGLEPIEPDAGTDALHLPVAALARWLVDVSGHAPGRKESDG